MKRVCFLLSLFLFFVLTAGVSFSSIVTYEFTATIDSIWGQYGTVDVIAGQSITGWFCYDDAVPNGYSGIYPEAFGDYSQNASMSVVLGSQTISCLNSPTSLWIHNANTPHPSDDDGFKFVKRRVSIIEAGDYSDMAVELHDLTKTAFSSNALPDLLQLSAFGSARFDCPIAKGAGMDYYFRATGTLTSLTLVPEPATLSLLALGFLFAKRKK